MDYRSPEAEAATRRRVDLLGALYSAHAGELAGAVDVDPGRAQDMRDVDDLCFANGIAREFSLLFGRAWRQASRNKLLVVSRRGLGAPANW